MKKKRIAVFLVVATLLSCVFAFAACDKDKDKDKGGKNGGAGETYTEEEIAALMGKLATYVIANSEKFSMNFEVPSEEERNGGAAVFNNCEWLVSSCVFVMKYDTAENATAAIENAKEEFGQAFEGDGEFTIEQHGAVLIVGGKDRIDAVRSTEDKSVELLSQEFINQYKANLKELLNSNAFGYQSFYYFEDDKTYNSNMHIEAVNGGKDKRIKKLANDATAEEIKAFNDHCSTTDSCGKGTKINDKLWFFVEE